MKQFLRVYELRTMGLTLILNKKAQKKLFKIVNIQVYWVK